MKFCDNKETIMDTVISGAIKQAYMYTICDKKKEQL